MKNLGELTLLAHEISQRLAKTVDELNELDKRSRVEKMFAKKDYDDGGAVNQIESCLGAILNEVENLGRVVTAQQIHVRECHAKRVKIPMMRAKRL